MKMEDEETRKENADPTISDDDLDSKSVEVTRLNVEKLQFLAEENVEHLHNVKVGQEGSVPENVPKYVPDQLSKKEVPFEEIRSRLIGLLLQEEEDQDEEEPVFCGRRYMPMLEKLQKISLVSHSLAAFIGMNEMKLVRKIALQILSETTLWISHMFRFFDSSSFFHRDVREGLVKVARLVLHTRYPKYAVNGYEALYTRPPVIYYNGLCRPGLEQYISTELGLPVSCITSVPGASREGMSCKMDLTALEKLISADVAAAKTPLLVIACAGSSLLGQIDDLQKLQELCHAHNVWLHVDGHALASLCLQPPDLNFDVVDSMTLWLGKWVGISNLSFVTLYRSSVPCTNIRTTALGLASQSLLDSVLPVWVTFQALGYESICRRIRHCLDLTNYFLRQIETVPEFRIIGKGSCKSPLESASSGEKQSADSKVPFADMLPIIVFQYIHVQDSGNEEKQDNIVQRNPFYFDNLNSWLVQLLARNFPAIRTDVADVDDYGVCLRICFMETAHVMSTTKKDIDYYCSCLQHQLTILNATVRQRELLYREHSSHRKLMLVQIKDWAGLGGARYIPEVWVDRLNELTDTGKEDINTLNAELVEKLKASDSAFSVVSCVYSGEADDGMLCVRFGMVDEDLEMEELVNLVISVGQEIEDSSKYLETMAEMVRHGIEEANKELIQENQEKLMQEGILKQVPVIGSLVSWWFPANTEAGIKGRSFDLSSGTIESTENIYKYHMQIKEGGPQTPPPATKVLISPSSQLTKEQTNSSKK